MKKTLFLLVAVAMLFVSCKKDDPTPTSEVLLTQTYDIFLDANTGDTTLIIMQDHEWENGLLKRDLFSGYHNSTYIDMGGYEYTYSGRNCIKAHFLGETLGSDRFFSYENGRLTGACELRNGDTISKVTIHSYTEDGHIKSMTLYEVRPNRIGDYEFTWENGDLKTIHLYEVGSDTLNKTYAISYDNSPNVNTGMPLTEALFTPLTHMYQIASKHNAIVASDELRYLNGRLVSIKNKTYSTYYTYSDGTTGKE